MFCVVVRTEITGLRNFNGCACFPLPISQFTV